jgi:hypothetical protein
MANTNDEIRDDMVDGFEREDSITDQDPHKEKQKKEKSRKPANTAFRQQRLRAWQ